MEKEDWGFVFITLHIFQIHIVVHILSLYIFFEKGNKNPQCLGTLLL